MTESPARPILPTLPMHLMLAMGCWLSSPFALPCAKNGSPRSRDKKNPLQKAVAQEARSRAVNLLSGLLHYLDSPYARDMPEPPCIWRRGNARLLDYGQASGAQGHRPLMLFVPSLINRYYILDLKEERSLLRHLASQGIYPLVLDWGEPGEFEQSFGAADYVTEILNPAIDFLAGAAGQPVALGGYCMGGVLALAAAQLKPKKLSSLALFAAPWDFHCPEFLPLVLEKPWREHIENLLMGQKTLSAEAIQSLFYLTDPWVFEQKFRRFAGLPAESRAAEDFVALERWVNDGVPMTSAAARDCLIGWAQENKLARGLWQVGGQIIDPKRLRLPIFISIPDNDHVVPLGCAMPLARALPQAQVVRPRAGHVGMIVGSHAKRELWQPLTAWIHKNGQ